MRKTNILDACQDFPTLRSQQELSPSVLTSL